MTDERIVMAALERIVMAALDRLARRLLRLSHACSDQRRHGVAYAFARRQFDETFREIERIGALRKERKKR